MVIRRNSHDDGSRVPISRRLKRHNGFAKHGWCCAVVCGITVFAPYSRMVVKSSGDTRGVIRLAHARVPVPGGLRTGVAMPRAYDYGMFLQNVMLAAVFSGAHASAWPTAQQHLARPAARWRSVNMTPTTPRRRES